MRTTAAFGLVVLVLLVGMTLPGVALQDAPPDPADGGGDGAPGHANGEGDGGGGDDAGDDGTDDGEDGLSVDATRGPSDDDGDGSEGDGGQDGDDGSDPVADDGDGSSDTGDGGGTSDSDDGDGSSDSGDRDDAGADGGATPDGDGGGDSNADADESGGGGSNADAGANEGGDPGDADGGSGTESRSQGDGRNGSAGDAEERSSSGGSNDDGVEAPSNPVTPLLPFFDDSGDDGRERQRGDGSRGTETDHGGTDPAAVPDDEETPTSEPPSTPAGSGGDDSGGEGSPPGSSGSSGDGDPSVGIRTNDSATVANVTGAEGGDVVGVDLRGPATGGERVAVESIALRVAEGGPFTVTVTRPAGETGGEAPSGVPVSYFAVGTDAASVENATLTLDVDESALPSGVRPADVEVLRRTDDGWETTATTYHEDQGVYTAETAGFSTFAVAAPADGPLQVTHAEVSGDGGSGENATAVATVENTGDRRATQTFAATVDGETVATREVTLEGGESATVTFDVPADRAGNGTVAVGGVEAGRLQVERTEGSAAAASTGGNLAFGVGAAVFVVLSAVGTGLLAARHEEWEWVG